LLAGNVTFLLNMSGMVVRFYRARAVRAFADATATVAPVEGRI